MQFSNLKPIRPVNIGVIEFSHLMEMCEDLTHLILPTKLVRCRECGVQRLQRVYGKCCVRSLHMSTNIRLIFRITVGLMLK